MYRCILVPVDGTAFGEHALPYAVTVARRLGATLHLVHVHVPMVPPAGVEALALPGGWDEIVKDHEREYMEGLAERLVSRGVRVHEHVLDGPVAETMEEYAAECGAGLVVMSTHAHAGLRRLWHHGVADHLVRHVHVPSLLVRPEDEDTPPDLTVEPAFEHILVPLEEDDEHAAHVLAHAAALGRSFGARYTLLLLRRKRADRGWAEGSGIPAGIIRLAERMRAAGVRVAVENGGDGDPAESIAAFAADPARSVDLIAMHAAKAEPPPRPWSTGTAAGVLSRSSIPLLLCPDPGSGAMDDVAMGAAVANG